MFFYIDQPCATCLSIRLVKTKSNFIVRSVEIDLGKMKVSGSSD